MHVVMQQQAKELEVMIVPRDFAIEVAEQKASLERYSLEEVCDAGYDVGGTVRACRAGPACPNYKFVSDDYGESEYCSQEEYHKLEAQVKILEHQAPMLDFYWNTRGKTNCQMFLNDFGLLTSYE